MKNKKEAKKILSSELDKFRNKTYEELKKSINEVLAFEIQLTSTENYQLEIEFFWDDKPNNDIRVMGSIDNGHGLSAFIPITDSFIKDSSNNFVDE
ncbi:MAG: hypothetical protein COA79_06725 [Planctomycetota bacterium]|nr:MAG: hypothetical protein COA79_06725 [Planctomycetota bacterium]